VEAWNVLHGYFLEGHTGWYVLAGVLIVAAVGYLGSPLAVWSLVLIVLAIGFGLNTIALGVLIAVLLLFNIKPLRKAIVSAPLMKVMKGIIPKISETERTALEAGVVWVEGELFSGRPDFKKILSEPYPTLTEDERAFMQGPVRKLCAVLDDWQIWKTRELEEKVWKILREDGFLGMIIPKEYGGLGFSAMAHSEVIGTVSTRSIAAATTIMVPNSLGPAELLVHYGTQAQKDHYLPRLARGEEVPCFALTEPNAGSDAGSITSHGVLFKGDDGKIYMRLNWNKRWITLAAISTVLGIAFRLYDPENLLGKGEDLGITCALVPSNLPGVSIGRRHDPIYTPFYNCPTQGKDVVVSAADTIIGGVDMVGKGWEMLMDSLAAGRGISLPGQSAGGAKLATRVTSAHAAIRKQFGVPIGKFEGVEEPLARIAGTNYILESLRRFTVGAIDQGIKPPVITAIAKYQATEMGRKCVNDAMDVMGGAGISVGPRNLLAHLYISTPIGITVEGANILTRTLIVFGQGALRAHPYAFKEVDAIGRGDLAAFDDAFWGHIGHVVRNTFRSVLLSLTRGYLYPSPVGGSVAVYYRRMAWTSASFAIMSDIAMGSLGGTLKMREKLTGRFADILSWMYIGSAVLRRYEAEGKEEDLPFVHYSMQHCFFEIQKSFEGIFENIKVPGLSWFFKMVIGSWARMNTTGSDVKDWSSGKIAQLIQVAGPQRDRLTEGVYIPDDVNDQLARLEQAFAAVQAVEPIEKKIKKAVRSRVLPKKATVMLIDEAVEKNVITKEEGEQIRQAEAFRFDAIQVDDFSEEEYHSKDLITSSVTGRVAL
jgi:acyl-CoA dehydrogenase